MVPRLPLPLDCPPGGVCTLTADRCQIASRRANPCIGCKPDALTRLRWHGLRYAAPPGMDL